MPTFADTLAMRLRAAYLRMHRAANATFAERGATADQFALLSVVAEEDGLSQRVIAARIFTDANTVAAMLALLERCGWIRRRAGAADGRVRGVRLTAAGRKLHAELVAHSEAYHRRLESLVPENRRVALAEALRSIAALAVPSPSPGASP